MATTKKKSKKNAKITSKTFIVQAGWYVQRSWEVKADSAEQARHLFLGLFPFDFKDSRVKELETEYVQPIDGRSLEDAIDFVEES